MNKKAGMVWAVVSAIWVLLMLNMSFRDLKYGLQYHFFHGRMEAEYQARLAAYEQTVQKEEDDIRKMLQAAKRYDELEFLSLAAKRNPRYWRAGGKQAQEENPRGRQHPAYERLRDEMAALEKTYGKATLRKYREQNDRTEQDLLDAAHARLVAPEMREPRLAAALFNMFSLPLAALLLLWACEQGYRRIVKYRL